jgi:hypothetical protein
VDSCFHSFKTLIVPLDLDTPKLKQKNHDPPSFLSLTHTLYLSFFFTLFVGSTKHRTPEGDMFVVKDPDIFAKQVIPQYFDHNKFSSFARQLNFYGFRKMQSKPIRNSDYDANSAKYVTFYNENFKRGRCDLLKKIQRSTRGNGTGTGQDHSREIHSLREQVATLEQKLEDAQAQTEERLRRLELDMLARMEQVMMAMQQQQHTQLQLHAASSVGTSSSGTPTGVGRLVPAAVAAAGMRQQSVQSWDPNALIVNNRNASLASNQNSTTGGGSNGNNSGMPQVSNGSGVFPMPGPPGTTGVATVTASNNTNGSGSSGPTLPPHPKQKQLPPMNSNNLPTMIGGPPDRLNSLRGISVLSRGLSGLTRGTSIESQNSAVLLRNSWEDKFFSMLMLDDNGNLSANGSGGFVPNMGGEALAPHPVPQGSAMPGNNGETGVSSEQAHNGSVHVSDRTMDMDNTGMPSVGTHVQQPGDDDLSSV